jgi:hypothetical protein
MTSCCSNPAQSCCTSQLRRIFCLRFLEPKVIFSLRSVNLRSAKDICQHVLELPTDIKSVWSAAFSATNSASRPACGNVRGSARIVSSFGGFEKQSPQLPFAHPLGDLDEREVKGKYDTYSQCPDQDPISSRVFEYVSEGRVKVVNLM